MFLITSERDCGIKGKVENRLFGIKLTSDKDVKKCLKDLDLEDLITTTKYYSLFREILSENENDRILFQLEIEQLRKRFKSDEHFEWPLLSKKVLNYIGFPSIYSLSPTHENEMFLKLAKNYFNNNKRLLYIYFYVDYYMKAFRELDYKLVQSTEEKVITERRTRSYNPLFGSISKARFNTLILMFLTGKTTFINSRGEEEPIILDGFIRTIPNWINIPNQEDEPTLVYFNKKK